MEELTHSLAYEMQTEDVDEINFDVLHPENPLMVRFQNALSSVLEKKLKTLQDELLQIQNETKKKRQDKEDLCEILFGQKSELLKIENSAYKYNELISTLIDKREYLKTEFSECVQKNKEEALAYQNEQKFHTDLRHKIEVQNYILDQLQKYEQTEASNLSIIHRAISKNKADQVIYLKEKIQKDCLLMKLENEVFKLELKNKNYTEQIDTESENLEKLEKNLASKTSEYEDALQDNSQLLSVWKRLVFLISKRDQEYSDLKMQLEKTEIIGKEKITEMNNYKEMSEKEMLRNETLTLDKNRKKSFLNSLEHRHTEMTRELDRVEHELLDRGNMIQCTEKILEETHRKQADSDRDLLLLENRLKKLINEKYELEESIISQLQSEVVSNNATLKLNEQICKLRQNSLQLELQIKELNNKYYKTCSILDENINLLETNQSYSESKKMEIKNEAEKKISKIEEELKILELLIKKEENRLADNTKRLNKLLEHPNACPELDEKVDRLSEMLKNINDDIEVKKQAWVRKQNEIMTMTEKKTQLASEMSQLDQQLNILRQKSRRIDENLKKTYENSAQLDKTIAHVLSYISKLNNECSIKKKQENALDSENCSIQNRVIDKLQNIENKVTAITLQIEELKNKKGFLEKELLDVQKQDLEWEKKVKLANEMKREILAEQSENGDIGSMKTEIHRMEIRYTQLKKAQESLISNLETCVLKRERIFDEVVLKDKKEIDVEKQEKKLKRHISILKDKNSKLMEKLESLQDEYVFLCQEKEKLSVETKTCESQIEILQNEMKDLDEKIREYNLLKHKNLETLIRKQKFADYLSKIKGGKAKTFTSSELSTERDFAKHQYLRQDLLDTIEMVMKENVKFRDDLIRITNILLSYNG